MLIIEFFLIRFGHDLRIVQVRSVRLLLDVVKLLKGSQKGLVVRRFKVLLKD